MSQSPDNMETAPLPGISTLEAQLEQALSGARAAGADAAEAALVSGRTLSVRVRRDEIESVAFQADRELAVTAYRGPRSASATTTDCTEAGIAAAAHKAAAMAQHMGADRWAGLADPERLAQHFPALDLHHPWGLTVDAAVACARECEQAALAADARIENSEGAEVDSGESIAAYANSDGFFGTHHGTAHGLSCSVIAGAGEHMVRDYWHTGARDPAGLESPAAVGRRAGDRAAARLGAVTPATTQASVVFPPELARSLFSHFAAAISGGNLYRDATFLKDRLGQTLFPAWLSLVQRPHLPAAAGSAGFDAEGVATEERDLVRDGKLSGYLLGSYGARRLGLTTTGNAGGVFNLCVEGGRGDLAALIGGLDAGLLVTQLMGHGVNIVNGDYSRGAAGFWIERGEIAYPVENVTIAGNLEQMFAGIVALGADADLRGRIRAPSLRIERMTIAGQ